MLCAPGRDRDFLRAERLFIGKENCDSHVRVLIARVQDAGRLMAGHLRLGASALGGNIAFGDCPYFFADYDGRGVVHAIHGECSL